MLLTLMLLGAACAFPGRAEPDAAPGPDNRVDAGLAIEALQRAEADLEQGRLSEAVTAADSLYRAWSPDRSLASLANRALWLKARALEADGRLGEAGASLDLLLGRVEAGEIRDQAVSRLATLWAQTGESGRAADLLLQTTTLNAPLLELLRDLVNELTLTQLRALAQLHAPDSNGAAVVHVQLAQLLIVEDQADSARRVARRALAANPDAPEREIATLIAESTGSLTERTVRIGAILPLSGRFGGVGQLLREGLQLAIEAYQDESQEAFDIQLLVRDDGSEPGRATTLLTELERQGVVAVIGPIGSESFAAALRARSNRRMLVISPTATEVLEPAENAYTLYDRERLDRDVAADLAEWVVRELRLRRTAVLYPSDPTGRATAGSFGTALRRGDLDLVASSAYNPDSTTFRAEIESLAQLEPEVVFVSAPNPQSVLTLAPQLFYYHLDHSIIIGNSAWADPAVLRRLARNDGDYRVLGMWVDRTSPGTPWQDFALDYERKYSKSLRDNILPALSYDAITLVLSALDQARLPIPAALSAFLSRGPELAGVTGRLRPDASTSTIGRRTQIRMLYDGQLVRPDRARLLAWLDQARIAAVERLEREKEDPPR
jgi:branched-chain amino acid transport system substrate-binding protein